LEFSTYIENKKKHINILKKQLKELVNRKQDLKSQISKNEQQLNNLSQKEKFALHYLKWHSNLHDTLKDNHNIDIKQIYRNFAKVIDDFNKYDFDPVKIINVYEKMESLGEQYDSYKRNIKIQLDIRNHFHQQVGSLEYKVSHFEETINKINELKEMGFGINEFKQLSNMLLEVASINKIDFNVAIKKFLKDVKNQYDSKLGFETAINQLNEEKRNIENEIPAYRAFINSRVAATQSMDYLQSNGLTVFDIIGISNLMKAFLSATFAFHSTKSMVGTNTQSNNLHAWEIIINSLKKLKDLIVEINVKSNELKDITTQIRNKLAEKQRIDNLLKRSTANLNSLALQGIIL
jgi:prefoldin subunit 5